MVRSNSEIVSKWKTRIEEEVEEQQIVFKWSSKWEARVKELEEQQILADDTDSKYNKGSIYRLPDRVVNLNKEGYLPQWISFGPYWHRYDGDGGRYQTLPMDKHKDRAFLYTLERSGINAGYFFGAVEKIVDYLLDSYDFIDPYWQIPENKERFVELMTIDGCFMLEILRKEHSSKNYPPDDPVFGKHGERHALPYIRRDMFLLQNQLPFLLLEKLAAVEKQDVKFVHNLILNFCSSEELPIHISAMYGCLHMVHLYKRAMFWNPNSRASSSSKRITRTVGSGGSATENDQAGITFQSTGTRDLNDVSFSNGVLRLPYLIIHETTESMLLNVLAFERFHVEEGSEVTSYVRFMSSLIKDVRDVRLLRSQDIIINITGNDITTLQLFKSLTKDMAFDPVSDLYKEVTYNMFCYRTSGWRKSRSEIVSTWVGRVKEVEEQRIRLSVADDEEIEEQQTRLSVPDDEEVEEQQIRLSVAADDEEVEEQEIRLSFADDDTDGRSNKCSIYRLPDRVVNLNKEAYLPQWISFGPYYWLRTYDRDGGRNSGLPMDKHKDRAFLYTLERSKQNPEYFFQAVEEIMDYLLNSYEFIDPKWRVPEIKDRVVELMTIDGCFMLEILRKEHSSKNYPPNDPVFGKHGERHALPYIRRDMFLLQNQLPFLLLEKLAAVEKQDVKFVHNLILNFCSSEELPIHISAMDGCLHMVHLYKRAMFWHPNSRASSSSYRITRTVNSGGSATENDQAGITFQSTGTRDLNDVSFSHGVLRLPCLIIHETTESMLLNVLAFERLHVGEGSEVTSYVRFMSSLIKDVRDVSLLRSQDIIINFTGDDTTTLQLFKSLTKDMAFDPVSDLYKEVTYNMVCYRTSGWRNFRSSLIATYIREWPILSSVAAAFLFILTITQTVYTVYCAYHK